MPDKRPGILILGASQMQLPAIRIGRELGWTVIVADANPKTPGVRLADYFEHVDLKDKEGMVQAASRHRAAGRLDGVFTAGTDFSATVAWVAEKLGLPGISYNTALDASDKERMRRVFDGAGLASPRFVPVTSTKDLAKVPDQLELPLVIKPVDNMGARGVRRADTADELSAAVEAALPQSRTGRVIVEEYIEGPEFSLDAIVYKGEITLCGIADRHICFPPYFVEMGHTMPTAFEADDQQRVVDLFCKGIQALGIENGAAKGDIKLSSTGPVIGEIAARLSGGYMSGWTYPYSSGVRVTEAAMKIAVGLSPGELNPFRCHTAAERAFISIPGVVSHVNCDIEDQNIREVFCRVRKGDELTFPTNNVEKCGSVIAVDPDRERAAALAAEACRSVFIRLEPFAESTREFLFGSAYNWAPAAFTLSVPGNREACAAMPPAWGNLLDAVTAGSVITLPELDAEPSTDWHGEGISKAFKRVLSIAGFQAAPFCRRESDVPAVGRIFWKAFLRGGVQGGVWVLDSLIRLATDRDKRAEVLQWLG